MRLNLKKIIINNLSAIKKLVIIKLSYLDNDDCKDLFYFHKHSTLENITAKIITFDLVKSEFNLCCLCTNKSYLMHFY